jgi:HK97 gp10 family phage protein
MADFGVEILGLKELDTALQELAWPAARRALRNGMRAGANVIRDEARAKAPVDTGLLKRQIRTRERSEDEGNMRFAVEITRSAFYGRFLEYGTSKLAARPFLRPAAETKTEDAVTKMRDSLAEAIQIELRRTRR